MRTYPEDARLTLAELAEWSETPADELLELERRGVIERGPDGLFPILETTNRMTKNIEAWNAHFRATHIRTPRGWALLLWEAPGKALDKAWAGYSAPLPEAASGPSLAVLECIADLSARIDRLELENLALIGRIAALEPRTGPPGWICVKAAAGLSGYSTSEVYARVRSGEFLSVKVGGKIRLDPASVGPISLTLLRSCAGTASSNRRRRNRSTSSLVCRRCRPRTPFRVSR